MRHVNTIDMKTTEGPDDYGRVRIVKTPYVFDSIPGNCSLFGIADPHEGNAGQAENLVKRAVADVKSVKNGYAILHGDQHEAKLVTSPHYSLAVHRGRKPLVDAQRDGVIEKFDPIGDRILGILDGNHELKLRNITTPNKDIAATFNTVYADGTFMKFIFPQFRLACWHGARVVGSKAGDRLQRAVNKMVSLKRQLRHLPVDDCEIVLCGHYHQLIMHNPANNLTLISDPKTMKLTQHYSEPGKIWLDKRRGIYRVPEEEKYYACCGAFLRAYVEGISTYTEERGLEASELGYLRIDIENDKIKRVETVKLG